MHGQDKQGHRRRRGAPTAIGRRRLLAGLGALAAGFSLRGCADRAEGQRLNFYTWDTYIGETTLADFRAATGIEVRPSYFATNDELFARLRAGNPGYDVIMPSNEFVTRMVEAEMLQPLDLEAIPNHRNLAPEFADPSYDPPPRHSLAYTWLVMGIGYRKSRVAETPDSWKWLFDSELYRNRIALVSEAADLIRLGARYKGHSINGLTPEIIRDVEQMLARQKPNIKTFHEDNGQDLLLAGDVDLVLEYNGDIAQVMREDPDLDFVVPKEGSLLNADTLAIPRGAPNPELAHRFINFLLDAEAGAHIAETILYPTPNAAAKKLMPPDYAANPVIFPTGIGMDNSEWGEFEGPEQARRFEEAMTRVRAA
jgi:spermidine/putrescine transport system substrate-binding protein